MDSDRVMVILTLVLVMLAVASNVLLFSTTQNLVGNVVSEVTFGLCLEDSNTTISTDCNTKYYQDEIMDCNFTANAENFTFYLSIIDPHFFNLEPTGHFYKELNQSDIGIRSFTLYAKDYDSCSQLEYFYNYNYEVYATGNNPPQLILPIRNQTWMMDSKLVAFDLNSHFVDPDGDNMTFNHTNLINKIKVSIDAFDTVTFTSESGFFGKIPLQFIATDTFGASTYSNIFWLDIKKSEPPKEEKKTETSSGGGGGFGGLGNELFCIPKWQCDDWSECYIHGYSIRDCYDTQECNTSIYKPNITEECDYLPTCFDKAQNGEEEGVDCGGECLECIVETCFDGIRNNREKGIDCGGPCDISCSEQTCFDGIKNGVEEGVDCGGICAKQCLNQEMPAILREDLSDLLKNAVMILAATSLLLVSTYNVVRNRKKIKKFFKKLHKQYTLTPKEAINFISELNKLESQAENLTPLNLVEKLSKIIGKYLNTILVFEGTKTNEEIEKLLAASDIKIKNIIINFFKELNKYEFSSSEFSKNKAISMIYEAKSLVKLTSENCEIIKMEPLTIEDDVFKRIIKVDSHIFYGQLTEAKNGYLQILEEVKNNKINGTYYSLNMARDLIMENENK